MAFIDQDNLARDSVFQQRVRVAMLTAASNVQSEAANTLLNVDAAAAATSLTVVSGAVFAVNDLVQIGTGLSSVETRKVTAIASNVLTVSATTGAHKAGEIVQKVIYNHSNRVAYAALVLNSPDGYVTRFAQAVCTNAAITTNSLDSDIQFQVNSIWNAMAGVP